MNTFDEEMVDSLIDALRRTSVIVEFTKKNGDLRRMICTRYSAMIPQDAIEDTKRIRSKNDRVIVVWDCEKQAWRSFTKESVLNWMYEFDQITMNALM
jgi:hypothetical protein